MQIKTAFKILASALLLSTVLGCNAALETPAAMLQSTTADSSQTQLEKPSSQDRLSFACLVDARNESAQEFFLVRQVVDTSTGLTKAFDQLATHVKKDYCLKHKNELVNTTEIIREKNTVWKENIVDEFACLVDVSSDKPTSFYFVRTTRDSSRGVVTSILALNQFTENQYCQNKLN